MRGWVRRWWPGPTGVAWAARRSGRVWARGRRHGRAGSGWGDQGQACARWRVPAATWAGWGGLSGPPVRRPCVPSAWGRAVAWCRGAGRLRVPSTVGVSGPCPLEWIVALTGASSAVKPHLRRRSGAVEEARALAAIPVRTCAPAGPGEAGAVMAEARGGVMGGALVAARRPLGPWEWSPGGAQPGRPGQTVTGPWVGASGGQAPCAWAAAMERRRRPSGVRGGGPARG